jgi:hypothetical protein
MTKRIDEICKEADSELERFYKRHGEWNGESERPKVKKEIRRCKQPSCGKRISNGEYCPKHKNERKVKDE